MKDQKHDTLYEMCEGAGIQVILTA